jgi:hypothetical protein
MPLSIAARLKLDSRGTGDYERTDPGKGNRIDVLDPAEGSAEHVTGPTAIRIACAGIYVPIALTVRGEIGIVDHKRDV